MGLRLCLLASVGLAFLLMCVQSARADKITLKDGTTLEGTAIPEPSGYWFKGPDGQTRHIAADDITSVQRGPSANSSGPGSGEPGHFSGGIAVVRSRADAADSTLAAISLWQQFIDSHPSADDLKTAQSEMARWKKMQQDGAERIKGRWISGDERKAIVEKAVKLHQEGFALLKNNQTLQGIKKLEEAQAIYPNSFAATFTLGYLYTLQKDDAKALGYLDQALKLKPGSPEVLGNMALCQFHKKQPLDAVFTLYKAAQNGDTPEIAQDLVSLLAKLTPAQRDSDRIKPAMDAANLLVAKYHIQGPGPLFLVPLRAAPRSADGTTPGQAGAMFSGSGFLLTPDGLILTNRHVVNGSKTLMVMIDGKKQRSAEIVNIDAEQDLALIRVKTDAPLPFLQLSPKDSPAPGAECTVMGFPLIDRLGENIKITRGVVASKARLEIGADVMVDAKVNPGNSGGPILNRFGNVMAIVSMKSLSSASEDSYGLGISAGQIRTYLAKNQIDLPKSSADETLPLSTEQIAAKVTPAAVCILSTR
jgi:tetratricopeptide (TPR) repeat protein